jgi:hypothetical protein
MAWMPKHFLLLALWIPVIGCGSTKSRLATEQLLVSDAVDQAVASIDFRSLAGESVYFDTRYLVNVKGVGFVNSEYIISSLRQQMVAADVRLKEKADDADFVIEARVGTLGSDGNEIIYGIPANKGLMEASAMVPGAPPLPAIPEISIARKEAQLGAVKVAAFAYDRKTGGPVWQSGIARTRTTSQDVWLFGAGPFQRGSIHSGMEFAGGEIHFQGRKESKSVPVGPPVAIDKEFYFPHPDVPHIAQQPAAVAPPPAPPSTAGAAPPAPGNAPAAAPPPGAPPNEFQPSPQVADPGAPPVGAENMPPQPTNPLPSFPFFK